MSKEIISAVPGLYVPLQSERIVFAERSQRLQKHFRLLEQLRRVLRKTLATVTWTPHVYLTNAILRTVYLYYIL